MSAETQTITHANLPPKVPGLENLGIFDGVGELGGKEVDLYEMKKVDTYYWFGTDGLGRDMFSRVWEGTQISLFIAFAAAIIDMVIGVAYGGISGYYGGRVDDIHSTNCGNLIWNSNISCRYSNASIYGTRYNCDYYCNHPYRLDWYVPNCSWSSTEIQKPRICIGISNFRCIKC